jgi:cell division septal protein FtsQ
LNERRVRVAGRQTYGRATPLRRPQRQRGWRPRGLGLLQRRLLLLVIGVGVVIFALARFFAVQAVTVKSAARGAEIKTEAQTVVRSSWRQGNLLTLDKEAFMSTLQQADPLIRSVMVQRKWLHTLTLTVVLKQPSVGWSSGGQQYLLDRDGTVIGMLSAGAKLPVVNDGSNLPVAVGRRAVGGHFVAFVTALAPALSAAGIGATSMDVKETTLDLSVSTNKGYRLVFDTSREVSDEMADLKSVLALLASQKKVPAEYIDLRIAGKAYYK